MTIDVGFMWVAFKEIIKALPLTLLIAIAPVLIGFLIGGAIAFIQLNRIKLLKPFATFYTSFFRGTPIIMHIMIIYVGIPLAIYNLNEKYHWNINISQISPVALAIFALSLTAGAYLSEIIRSGIEAVSKGQMEAASSIGMTAWQSMYRIVLPQALAKTIPNITNLIIGFLHATSIAFIISIVEITGASKIVASINYKFLESYIVAGLIYWGLTVFIEFIAGKIEKKVTVYSNQSYKVGESS